MKPVVEGKHADRPDKFLILPSDVMVCGALWSGIRGVDDDQERAEVDPSRPYEHSREELGTGVSRKRLGTA